MTATDGVIGYLVKAGDDRSRYFSGDTYVIAALRNAADRGGPVFDRYGDVIAISVSTKESEWVNFALPIKYALELVQPGPIRR
jgi:S1-C subfamily serine protease